MRKMLAIMVVLAMFSWIPVFACSDPDPIPIPNPTTTIINNNNPINNNTVKTDIKNTNANDIKNTNNFTVEKGAINNTNQQQQGQIQRQQQKQDQTQNNDQTIAPVQSVNINTPRPLLSAPYVGIPELNFIDGEMEDITAKLPKFNIGILPLGKDDVIDKVLLVNANEKFKNLYKDILNGAKDYDVTKVGLNSVRYQVIRARSSKTWASGGNIAGAASGFLSGTGSAITGGLVPVIGRSKSDNLYTIIFVQVLSSEVAVPVK